MDIASKMKARLFPQVTTFDTSSGAFVPLPYFLRNSLSLFSRASWQIYTYILMKCGPGGAYWLSNTEIATACQYSRGNKISVHLKQLRELGFIVVKRDRDGRQAIAVPSPYLVLSSLAARGAIDEELLDMLNDDLERAGFARLKSCMTG